MYHNLIAVQLPFLKPGSKIELQPRANATSNVYRIIANGLFIIKGYHVMALSHNRLVTMFTSYVLAYTLALDSHV